MTPPRVPLAVLPTALERMPRLERALGAGPLYVKRDDLTGFGVAGNKARALEYLLGAALADDADVLVAAGSPSSNFCAAAALAAARVGLECQLLIAGAAPSTPSVNLEMAKAAGARLLYDKVARREDLDSAVEDHAADLRAAGRRPMPVPRGGATATGSLGYAYAARELAEQSEHRGTTIHTVVVATGSGATQAGLVAGQVGFGLPWRVVGASVSRPADSLADQMLRTSRECAKSIDLEPPTADDVDLRDCRGEGFGIASDDDRRSARLALTHEGLLLDDYYGAKALTLFRTLLADSASTPAVFWHTGGVAAALTALRQGAR
ncbi:MAG TPA: pyridoxal-phosphate dependent enzyme [Nocardioidaceae bacterium]|nr:pyridoxal-phosphate dependent enzyme [Nocardioidaceae bacterium]